MEEEKVTVTEVSFELRKNPELYGSNISQILLVHDAVRAGADADLPKLTCDVVEFLTDRGYHVVTLEITDGAYKNARDFVVEFEQFVKQHKNDFVWVIVQYAQTEIGDVCMYCNDPVPKHSLLLKQAFASLYVHIGRERCSLIAPPRCCDYSPAYLPPKQVEGMLISTADEEGGSVFSELVNQRADVYEPFVWAGIEDKLTTIRLIDSHKPEKKHRRTLVEEVVEIAEPALTEEVLTRLIVNILNTMGKGKEFADILGITEMEWDEYVARSGNQTLFLVIRRIIIVNKQDGWLKMAGAFLTLSAQLGSADYMNVLNELSLLVVAFKTNTEQGKSTFLSDPNWKNVQGSLEGAGVSATGTVPVRGPWKSGVTARPEADEGTHLDKLDSKFIPPYMRDRLAACTTILDDQQGQGAEDESEKDKKLEENVAAMIRHAQELDAEYENQKMAREIQDYQLMGGFSMRDRLPTSLSSKLSLPDPSLLITNPPIKNNNNNNTDDDDIKYEDTLTAASLAGPACGFA